MPINTRGRVVAVKNRLDAAADAELMTEADIYDDAHEKAAHLIQTGYR